mmetsp:Transcript_26816/g.65701  ORF Transcript_26816/g.65701 Transcript_26816/m.65701 type:complete len:308 (-) Transcript_26816:1-924(-)
MSLTTTIRLTHNYRATRRALGVGLYGLIGPWLLPSKPGLLRFFSRLSIRFSTLLLARLLRLSLRLFCLTAMISSVRSVRSAHLAWLRFFCLASFLTLFCSSLGSSSTFSPPARSRAASHAYRSATFLPAPDSAPPASSISLRWSIARRSSTSLLGRFRLGGPLGTPPPKSMRPYWKSSAFATTAASSVSSPPLPALPFFLLPALPSSAAPTAASAFSLRFFSCLVFFFSSRHSLAWAAFSWLSSALRATRLASILALRRWRSSSRRSAPPPPDSPSDQPDVGGAPAGVAEGSSPSPAAAAGAAKNST